MSMIEVKNLSKRFGDLEAVKGIFFEVAQGEIFGFLGPNGAGKSTSISMLATILSPTSGDAFVNGQSVLHNRNGVRASIGLVFQDPSLDDRLTAMENLRFHAQLYGVPKSEFKKRAQEVLELVDLSDRAQDLIRTFSGGMKRRLEIARGLIHYPRVLFLDEPTIGLDPQTRSHLWEYILRLKREKGMTIFMTTHYMNEAEYCDRIAIIDQGTIVALDTPAALKKRLGGDVVRMQSLNKEALVAELKRRYGTEVHVDGESVLIEVENGESFLPKLFQDLQTTIRSIELRKPTLDDVFLALTGRAIRAEEASSKDQFRQHARMRGLR
ncbi:ATP-binding cassette domain-containing protein [Candidatus Uhrbacteria bacterium]|nr:ATP-binding cassette domain-containing protein [Candidatus Uhrbacteria bacterium]